MSRKAAREAAVQILYEYGFHNEDARELLNFRLSDGFCEMLDDETDIKKIDEKQHDYITRVVLNSIEKQDEINNLIKTNSIRWKINRISRIARAIMQVAIYEILYMDDISEKVAINEAVEIAKKYDSRETVAFINGVLGSIVRKGS
ncbi:MAG: transcription antitermination factor NusB [Clostridiales bacterium]|nr:transcription antitermination factor NusB [Clostridiales bacterium]